MHIAVAGNIGSGKTTLANMLAQHYGWTLHKEPVISNPYLEDYYEDIHRWAFNVEVFFLKERFKAQLAIARDTTHTNICDRSIFEGVYVFAANNYAQGQLSRRDFDTYMELFHQMTTLISYPDLLVYLRASIPHLVGNISKRGRQYEQSIPLDYLEGLNARYEAFVSQYEGRLMVVDVDGMDYLAQPSDFEQIVDSIDAELFGLFKDI